MNRSRVPAFLRSPGGVFGAGWLAFMFLASITAPLWRPYDVAEQDLLARLQGPSGEYWLGTDAVGRDLLSRVFTAGALPLLASAVMVVVAFGIGLPLILIAAEREGRVETAIGRFAETLMSLPSTVVLLAAIGAIGNRIYPIMMIFGLLISAALYRVLIGVAKSSRRRLYIDAARVDGMGSLRVNLAHVLPAMARPIAVQGAIIYAIGLVIINGLAFLGFGPGEPQPSWGFMIKDASDNIFNSPWLMVPPGVALSVTVLAANALADALAGPLGVPEYSPPGRRTTNLTAGPGTVTEPPGLHTDGADGQPGGGEPPALSVRDLSVSVDDGPQLVDGVSFDLRPGEVLGLVGESGCGKTMTARSLLGLLPAGVGVSSGSILWQGRQIAGLPESEAIKLRGREIAMISQEPMVALDPLFSVKTQLTGPIRRFRNVGRREARRLAVELLGQVGIVDAERVLSSYPHQLSGGMAQRVAIALALTGSPKLLIADEPTTALDVTVQAEILSLLRSLVAETGMSVVLVSHDLGVVADICDQISVMYAGQVVESGAVAEVLNDPNHPYTMALLGANPHVGEDEDQPERLAAIAGTVPPPGSWPTGCHFAARCQFATQACEQPTAPLPAHVGGSCRCVRSAELRAGGARWEPEPADPRLPAGAGTGGDQP
jgi:peptide/nickel transport system permease protein